jgi:hypothetical protein
VHRDPTCRGAEALLTERSQRHPVAHQHLGRAGDEHLAAVGERRQPCRAVHLGADVRAVAFDCVAGVQAHADGELHERLVA